MKTKKILMVILTMCLTFDLCGSVSGLISAKKVNAAKELKISNTKYSLDSGKRIQLEISGSKGTVKWSSSNKKVATVDSKGNVTAIKAGKAVITGKVGSKKLTCSVTVKGKDKPAPIPDFSSVKAGDVVTFGVCEQDSKNNGYEQLEWYVLDKQEDKVLLITKDIIDSGSFSATSYELDGNWENSNIRKWLNKTFINESFVDEERSMLIKSNLKNPRNPMMSSVKDDKDTKDYLFLLSIDEVREYFGITDEYITNDGYEYYENKMLLAHGTVYAYDKGLYLEDIEAGTLHVKKWGNKYSKKATGQWWLRTPGQGYGYMNKIRVYPSGYVRFSGQGSGQSDGGIRPAVWVKIK